MTRVPFLPLAGLLVLTAGTAHAQLAPQYRALLDKTIESGVRSRRGRRRRLPAGTPARPAALARISISPLQFVVVILSSLGSPYAQCL